MKAKVYVTLKNGVLDPQGKAIEGALHGLGFSGVEDVRQGKFIELEVAETDEAKAKAQIDEMCRKLLANTVIENYRIELA
ncbi:phosphoribosylformylglycinamidine synthase subunit PurS [Pedomonas mirosovicensis]|uniref:phosphoribosylformylglycinamidine synthase subunit PurS n=1 Tax=Pedomonas mirosovicensis TaxID=2908641 RepID=UPI00216906F9|nr:phosphoribosylformylglycinamidine synthase subunit PurS [Pedomonas mirosovicensis]MCH8686134.1 phosphoribosylformylglycinamidine synthase subunit PurS [Pedomonas mirosovicensis]